MKTKEFCLKKVKPGEPVPIFIWVNINILNRTSCDLNRIAKKLYGNKT